MSVAVVVGVSLWSGESNASGDLSQKVGIIRLSPVADVSVLRPPFEEASSPENESVMSHVSHIGRVFEERHWCKKWQARSGTLSLNPD